MAVTGSHAMFLERERELDRIGAALAEAGEGRGRIVLVEAPAGLGKTSVLEAAGELAAEAGFITLRARASELERDFAYGCVRQLLEPLVVKASDSRRDLLFQGAAAFSGPLFGPTASLSEPSSADSSFAMLHGLYWLLNNLVADGPATLSLDDLQWSDAESLRLLAYLAPRLDGLRLAVLATARTGESGAPDVERLASAPESTVLRLEPLSVEATATLCEHRLGAPASTEFARACHEATDGNPFFLEALLREAQELGVAPVAGEAARVRGIGPSAVSRAVLLRLSGAPAEASALVRAVAVLGDGAAVQEAAQLAEIPEASVAAAADRLVSLAILKPGPRLEFAHAIVREAVYADIGPHERANAHARAAAILAAAGAHDERIAAQLVEAAPSGDSERVELLRRVGAEALARGAPAAAAAWLGRAVLEQPAAEVRGELLLELGSAELRLGRREAVDHLSGAVELLPEPARHATAVRQLAHALTRSGRSDEAVVAIVSAIEALEPNDREQALLLEGELGYHAQHAGLETRALAVARLERLAELEGATPGERLVLAGLACDRARSSDSAGDSQAHLENALANWRALGDPQISIAGLFYDLVAGLLAVDAPDVADACLEHVLVSARARSSVPEVAYATCWRGWASMRQGAVEQAAADARTALELFTTHRLLGRRFALGLLVQALVEAGDLDAAERALRESGLDEEIPPSRASNYLLGGRALLRLAQGRTREGLDDLLEFGRRDELYGAGNPRASRWRSYASLALASLGETDRARDLAADDLQRARRWGTASGIGLALRATVLTGAGQASADRLQEAVDALRGSPANLEHARALVDLGAALRRANRRAEARGALQAGVELAERCGARPLAEHGRVELRAAGGRSSDPSATGAASLTVSERRIAELAAEGRSNPEIAQALYVTRKTVETHLGHVYRKLEIGGRAELPRALVQEQH
jgi:DNA-binding CsgD family transcriptional regulator